MSKLLDRHEAPLPDGWGYRGSTKPPTNSVKPKAFATQTFADAPDPLDELAKSRTALGRELLGAPRWSAECIVLGGARDPALHHLG